MEGGEFPGYAPFQVASPAVWRPDPASEHTADCQLVNTFAGEPYCPIACLEARLHLTVWDALALAAEMGR